MRLLPVKSSAPATTTSTRPSEKAIPASRRTTPKGRSPPPAATVVEKTAPSAMNAPASTPSVSVVRAESPAFASPTASALRATSGGGSASSPAEVNVASATPRAWQPKRTTASGPARTGGAGLPRAREGARSRDADAARAEVGLGEAPHDSVRTLGRVEGGDALADELRRNQDTGLEPAVACERHAEDAAHRERPTEREHAVAAEVAERVRDQPALVPLHAAKDVRAVTDHEIGAGVDRRVGEPHRIAAVLAQERLRPGVHVLVMGALGAHVRGDDDHVRRPVGLLDRLPDRGQVRHRPRPRVRREPEHGEPDLADLLRRDLAGPTGVREPEPVERGDGVGLARRA